MTGFADLARRLEDAGQPVRKAIPRDPGHLLLELSSDPAGGAAVAGQWYADAGRADRVAASTARSGSGLVRRIGHHVVIQAGGADRRLPALRALVGGDGASLVAHRPERRAVVRHPAASTTRYTKVVRPGRTEAVARGLRLAAGVGAPGLVAVDDTAGTVTTESLPGITWYDAWRVSDAPALVPRAATAVGRLVRELHGLAPCRDLPAHSSDAQLRETRRWVDLAEAFGVLPIARSEADRLLGEAARLLADTPVVAPCVVHRDLHDKQLMVADSRLGLLDLDLLALGDRALDLANLLVHLELRCQQGLADRDLADAAAERVLDGYRADTALRRRLAGHAVATRLRLACVYGFRPGSRTAAADLLSGVRRR